MDITRDIIEIKDEHKVTLMVKQETTDCEVVVDNYHVKILDIKEETENESVNFEKVFLPEVCDDVSVDSSFFDYNKYTRKCKLPEDVEPNVSTTSIHREHINLNLNTYNDYKQMAQERYRMTWDEEPTFQENFKPNYEYNIHENNQQFIKHGSKENSNNSNLQYTIHEKTNVLQTSAQIMENNIQYAYNDSPNIINEMSRQSTSLIKKISPRVRTKKRLGDADDDCRYKCHLCKRPRAFYTLQAVNNHLKFEHICVFSDSKLKEIKTLAKDKDVIINSMDFLENLQ